MGRARGILSFVLVALTLHCSSHRAALPFPPLGTTTREEAWGELLRLQREFPGARSLVAVRATTGARTQSFKADLIVDREGRLRLDGFTPLGTAAFAIFAEGERLLFVDHTSNSYWRGSVRTFAERVGLFPRDILPRDLAMILLGLPSQERFEYRVEERGMARVAWEGGSAEYDPPAFPPVRVRLSVSGSASQSVEVRHLDLSIHRERVTEPRVDRSYREAAPRISF